MRDQQAIFRELRTSIAEAITRAEERMSHVQRQLAGWLEPAPRTVQIPEADGWHVLQEQTEAVTAGVDQELAAIHASLAELVQTGKQLKSRQNVSTVADIK